MNKWILLIGMVFAMIPVCIIGWIGNIVSLAQASHIGGLEALRIIGIFLVPLGAVLGFL